MSGVFPRFITARLRGRIEIFICLLLFWMGGVSRAAERNPALLNYSIETWQTENGLPYSSVTSIVQTRDGYIWLGTYNGLVRFDGIRFTVFDASNTPELKSSRVTSLYEDAAGNLWIGHETGDLTELSGGHFRHLALSKSWPGGEIIAIDADEQGSVWLLNNAGWLYRVRDQFSIPSGKSATPAESGPSFVKQDGKLYLLKGTLLGWVTDGKIITELPVANSAVTNSFQRACACRDGGLWLVGEGRIRKWDGHSVTDVGAVPWGKNSVMTLLENQAGTLLAGTLEAGLFMRFHDGSSRQFSHENGLSRDWVRCLCEDREGTMWIGTGGGGLAALRVRSVSMVKVPDDWQDRSLLSVTTRAEGGLWIGTEGGGLYQWDKGISTHYDQTNGLGNAFDWSALEDSSGQLWVGTWGSGLFFRKKDGFKAAQLDPTAIIPALYQARDGGLWLGTSEGLLRYDNGVITVDTRKSGFVLPDVRTIIQDASSNIWFGMSGGGLGRLAGGKLTQYRQAEGLPSDFVWSLFIDEENALWIGTFGGGLCRYKDGKFVTISTREGLPNNVICHIADDGHGNFWISSYAGIFRVHKSELRRCADGQIKTVNVFTYGKEDGLSTLECSGGFQPSGCQTPDGRLWFPTTKGLAVVDPANFVINPIAPPVVIEEVVVDDKLAAEPQASTPEPKFNLEIPPGKQRFEFHYAGLSLVAPDKVRFKYRLEGLENEWVDAGTRRVAYYSYLKPGDYIFHVQACNNDGVWNEDGAAIRLKVLPQFWQTWWFTVGAGLAAVGLVAGLARYTTRRRLRQKLERLERQRAIERERARIAKDIHDDLGASLTRITMLSQSGRAELDNPHQAAEDLDQIYLTARELTRAMDEIVWAVSPQHDTLDSLVNYLGKFAQDFLSVAGIRCRLDVPMALPAWPLTAEVRHNLFLALKEALNNVLKHASATEVRVSLALTDSGFMLRVDDNGKGFVPVVNGAANASIPVANSVRLGGGNGLPNMRKRLEEIGGDFELRSSPGEGATVKFIVRVRRRSPATEIRSNGA